MLKNRLEDRVVMLSSIWRLQVPCNIDDFVPQIVVDMPIIIKFVGQGPNQGYNNL